MDRVVVDKIDGGLLSVLKNLVQVHHEKKMIVDDLSSPCDSSLVELQVIGLKVR